MTTRPLVSKMDPNRKRQKTSHEDVQHVLKHTNGIISYCGNMASSIRSGYGTSFLKNGVLEYCGFWANDNFDGIGSLYYDDKSACIQFRGLFNSGNPHGKITEYDKIGRIVFEGQMNHGKKISGIVTIYEENSIKRIFCSEFTDGEPRMNCKIIYHNNTYSELFVSKYEGSLKNFHPDGNGKLYRMGKLIYSGEFVQNVFEGNGILYENDFVVYCGNFHNNQFHGPGVFIMNRDSKPFVKKFYNIYGEFNQGNIQFGKIMNGAELIYEGDLLNFNLHGNGTFYKNQCKFITEFSDGSIKNSAHATIKFTKEGSEYVLTGNVEYTSDEEIAKPRIHFNEATLTKNNLNVFTGTCHFHIETSDICQEIGTIWINGKKRVSGYFQENLMDVITEVFDEEGNLVMIPVENEGDISELDENYWPLWIGGPINIFENDGTLMYPAAFLDGSIRNVFFVANSTPIKIIKTDIEPTDIISLEKIPYNTVAYRLNSFTHIVSKETLQSLKTTKNLRHHPFTRAPVTRISRVMFVP